MKTKKIIKSYPQRASDVSVTQKMLYGVRDELKSDLRALEHSINARFEIVDSKFERMTSDLHQMKILMEEQNSKNNVVLDGLTNLFYRQESTNGRVDDMIKPSLF